MKKFIIKTIVFSFITLLLFVWICSQANGYTDPFYARFTTPQQNSLIIGSSRAAQGIQPAILKKVLKEDIYNYSFTILHSPYGATYLNSIKKKLNPNSENGIFIVTVDPWSISSFTKQPNDTLNFRELNLSLANTPIVNIKPNPFYLFNNWDNTYFKLLTKKESNIYLHDNGWLEINSKFDSIDTNKNIAEKVKMYRTDLLPKAQFSQTRFNYLKKTINFLNNHGDVYLVRLPIHNEFMQIENELMPNFNNRIKEISVTTNGYLDLTNNNEDFKYTDGNHLHQSSGKTVTEIIANWIRNIQD